MPGALATGPDLTAPPVRKFQIWPGAGVEPRRFRAGAGGRGCLGQAGRHRLAKRCGHRVPAAWTAASASTSPAASRHADVADNGRPSATASASDGPGTNAELRVLGERWVNNLNRHRPARGRKPQVNPAHPTGALRERGESDDDQRASLALAAAPPAERP
jgi:hypothetical protein